MSLTGHIEDLGLSDILHVVGAARRSGLLRVESVGAVFDVLFRRGEVVAAREVDGDVAAWAALTLVRVGAGDEAECAALVEEAESSGRSPGDVVIERGRLAPLAFTRGLELEIERLIARLAELRHGTFVFRLVPDERSVVSQFAGLVLPAGIAHSRLTGPRGAPRAEPSARTGRARLLVPEDAISLPGVPLSRLAADRGGAARRAQAQAAAEAAVESPLVRPHRVVLVALPAGELRKAVEANLSHQGIDVRALSSLGEAELASEVALGRGADVVVMGHGSHAAMPGIELLARVRSIDRRPAFVLVSEAALPAARQAALHERAARLGAQILAVVPLEAAETAAVGRDLAERVVSLLAPDDRDGTHHPLTATGAGDFLEGGGEPRERRDAAQLAALARTLTAGRGDAIELALALLDVTADWFERAVLVLRTAGTLRPMGGFEPHGDRPSEALLQGRSLPEGDDFLSRAVKDGRVAVGPRPASSADDLVLRFLGAGRPGRIAVLPLLDHGGAFAAIYGDDGGSEDAWPDLAPLARFLAETSSAFAAALEHSVRRTEAQRLRRAAGG